MGTPPPDLVAEQLFEVGRKRQNIDFSSRVGYLASRLPPDCPIEADALLFKHTTFPYYATFMPSKQRAKATAARLDPSSVASFSGSGWKWLSAEKALRFCPECLQGMLQSVGELYWRRDHQIPTILVCPVHGCILRFADTSNFARRAFCPATPATCPRDAAPVIERLAEAERVTLLSIAVRSASLLLDGTTILSKPTDPDNFRRAMRSKGLLQGEVRTDLLALKTKMTETFGHLGRVWPHVFATSDVRGSGAIDRIAGAGNEVTDPLIHVMLSLLLDELPDALPQERRAFGEEPWECPNLLAGHADRRAVTQVVCSKTDQGIVGHFRCDCGYEYVRTARPDGTATKPRITKFGPTLAPLLETARAERWNIKRTAEAAGIHPKTLNAHAEAMGLTGIWTKTHCRKRA